MSESKDHPNCRCVVFERFSRTDAVAIKHYFGTVTGRITSSKPNITELDRWTGAPVAATGSASGLKPGTVYTRTGHGGFRQTGVVNASGQIEWEPVAHATTVQPSSITGGVQRAPNAGAAAIAGGQSWPYHSNSGRYGAVPPAGAPQVAAAAIKVGDRVMHSSLGIIGKVLSIENYWQTAKVRRDCGTEYSFDVQDLVLQEPISVTLPSASPAPVSALKVGDYVKHTKHGWEGEIETLNGSPATCIVKLISGQRWKAFATEWEAATPRPTPVSREPVCTGCGTRNEYQEGPYVCGQCRMEAAQRA